MPTKEEKHHSSGGGSNTNGSGSSNSSGTEKQHKYCFLCNRNEFTLISFDPTIEKDLRSIYSIDIKFKENRKVCLQCLHSIKLLKRSGKDEPTTVSTKKYNDCCKDLFENVTYLQELRNKYLRYVNRLIDSRKDKESPKKTSDSSNQSTPTKCSPVSCSPSTSPDVIHITPQTCIKQQQQSTQQTKLNNKSPKTNANGKSLKPVDTNRCKGIERLQAENVNIVKTKEKEKDTAKYTAGGSCSKNKLQQNQTTKKDVITVQDSEKQKSSSKAVDDFVKQKSNDDDSAAAAAVSVSTKSNDSATKSNKRRTQDRNKNVEKELSNDVAESETKTKLSNSSANSIERKASNAAENKTDVLIASKITKPSKLPTNTVKTRVQRSSSPKRQRASTQTPTRQQKSQTFEQALSLVETTSTTKTQTRTQKRSVLTQTQPEEVTTNDPSATNIDEKIENLPNELTVEKFEFLSINGVQIEVPERAKSDPKMFNCFVNVSKRPYPKRKLNEPLELILTPAIKKKKNCNDHEQAEPVLNVKTVEANVKLCNNRTPKSILQKSDRSRDQKKRVSFIGVPPASPPSKDKSKQINQSKEQTVLIEMETDVEIVEKTTEEIAPKINIETPKKNETSKKDETPAKNEILKKDSAPMKASMETVKRNEFSKKELTQKKNESKKNEQPKKNEPPKKEVPLKKNETSKKDELLRKELPNEEISLSRKKTRASKKLFNEISGNVSQKIIEESPTTTNELNNVPIVQIEDSDTATTSAPDAQSIPSCDAIIENKAAETILENTNKNIEVMKTIEEINIDSDDEDDLQHTVEPIKRKKKPYTRTKRNNTVKSIIVEPIKEKHVTKRQRRQVDKIKRAKITLTEAKDDIEIVNLEEIKRNKVLENVIESPPIPPKPVDETDEDEVKLLIEADPLAMETDSVCASPSRTPVLTPISMPISAPKFNIMPETSKAMTSAQVICSHENPLKIKISNGKVVQSDSPPLSNSSKGSNHVCVSTSKLVGRSVRSKRIRKKKTISLDFVNDIDTSASETEEIVAPISSIERSKRQTPAVATITTSTIETVDEEEAIPIPLTKRPKENVVNSQLIPSMNAEEVNRSVDQTPTPTQIPIQIHAPTPIQLPMSLATALTPAPPPVPDKPYDDRVFRAYVLVDKILQQANSGNLEMPNTESLQNLHSHYQPVSVSHIYAPAISQATVNLPQMDSMNGNHNGCVTAVIRNNVIENIGSVENENGHENEPHSMNVIQNYTNDGLNNDGNIYEMQETTTICENVESPTMPIVQTDNAGGIIGFESPATVDSTTSGYSSATATSSVYLVDTQSLNHTIDVSNGYNTDFNMQLESFPFVEIQTSDIIDILGKTNDCGDSLSMENISLDTSSNANDTRTIYLTDDSINAINTLNTINTVATMTHSLPTLSTGNILGVFRTKASLKQIDPPPMHLLNDGQLHGHQMHHHFQTLHQHIPIQVHGHGHGSTIPTDISAKMLRTDNPLLNAVISSNEESSIEMQDANDSFTMTVDSMVTSSDTVQATQRRTGLNVIFSTPSKRNNVYLSNENVSIDEFISESHQTLLNPDNFPTTTTSEEPHLDFYTLGI